MAKQRYIELLAPAKDLACGLAAINHGADAVYIGAARFGARAAAGNSIEDIAQLVDYAHLFGARVYVTLNTILSNEELAETETLIHQLYRIGVDALIVQDMGILQLQLPPIALHASTQMDNRTPQKVRFLYQVGLRQAVLARELSLDEIHRIHQEVPEMPLEVFVHGALCVSYSGQCYASEHCYHRSANRGECAQFCRLAFNLVDANGRTIVRDRHLLSLRDLNQSDVLEQLLDAGVSSLKIEGRLKDVSYVKNITAYYRQQLDAIMQHRPEYRRASAGSVTLSFKPQPDKSFSRGFTHYMLHGRTSNPTPKQGVHDTISSIFTPKSMGEEMGYAKEQRGGWLSVAGVKAFHNGDGACYLDEQGKLQGFRINKVEGNKLFPAGSIAPVKPRTTLYRNYDQEFEKLLQRDSASRKIAVSWQLWETSDGFALQLTDEQGLHATRCFTLSKEVARTPQEGNIVQQLSKLGNTPFTLATPDAVEINLKGNWFIPSSVLADWKRQVVELLIQVRRINHRPELAVIEPTTQPYLTNTLSYTGNVFNDKARSFYKLHGVQSIAPAYEKQPAPDAVIMFCKHCIRHTLGMCKKQGGMHTSFQEPFYLVSGDKQRFRLEFDCRNCQMLVLA